MRKIREEYIALALDEDPPSDFEDDIEDENDKEFFYRCDRIEYEDGNIRIVNFNSDSDDYLTSDDEDYNSESEGSSASSKSNSVVDS